MKLLILFLLITSLSARAGISVAVTYAMCPNGRLSNCSEICSLPSLPYPNSLTDNGDGSFTFVDPLNFPWNSPALFLNGQIWNSNAKIINLATNQVFNIPTKGAADTTLLMISEQNK